MQYFPFTNKANWCEILSYSMWDILCLVGNMHRSFGFLFIVRTKKEKGQEEGKFQTLSLPRNQCEMKIEKWSCKKSTLCTNCGQLVGFIAHVQLPPAINWLSLLPYERWTHYTKQERLLKSRWHVEERNGRMALGAPFGHSQNQPELHCLSQRGRETEIWSE